MLSDAVLQSCKAYAREYDSTVLAAVGDVADLGDILTRLSRVAFRDGTETVLLDGKPIVWFGQMEVRDEYTNGFHSVSVTRPYKVITSPDKESENG